MSSPASLVLKKLRKLYPDATCGLTYSNPYELLVATILSAQCTDKRVNLITPALFKRADTPEKMVKLGEKELKEAIRSCGFYQNKAKNILAASRQLLEKHQGKVPNDFDALTQLPGVGRKTANVVMANAFGVPSIAVDTHVFRLSHRLGWAKGKTPDQVEMELQKVIPRRHWSEAHHLLIYHGRNLCRARNPLCPQCPLTSLCQYYQDKAKP